jgi:hypothetical protein
MSGRLGKLDLEADSLVRCTTCGYEEWVRFKTCLALGWPKCHGATMRLETHPDIEKATTDAIDEQIAPLRTQKRRF